MSHIAVERALVLLRYIVDNPEGLSIREVSREYGYSPATVQKLISGLHNQGFVVQNKTTERYHLGPEAVQLGLAALSRLEVRQLARSSLEALSAETGETVFLAIARGDHVIYIDKVVSDRLIRMDAPLGVARPYNCTSVGKVLLSGMPNDKLADLAATNSFESRTENSIIELEALQAEIDQVRQRGWAIDREEYAPGAYCIGAPIFDHEGNIIAALTVSGPAERIKERLEDNLDRVITNAKKVSEALGYRANG
jgi:DNA-binding IclR family transcriptional regulator